MKSFIRKVIEKESDEDVKKYFLRFGKGHYKRRFLISLQTGSKLKVKAGFEFANEFVEFVRKNKEVKFSGKVLSKSKVTGKDGRKKASIFVYEISDSSLEGFDNPYYYLLDADSGDIVLKMKKGLPKPGKNEDKIDDKFCSLELDSKYYDKVVEMFFWDVPRNAKKIQIEHEIIINEIELPKTDDPVKIRELAKKKGILRRKITADGKETVSETKFEI